jgi:hypothetical protein
MKALRVKLHHAHLNAKCMDVANKENVSAPMAMVVQTVRNVHAQMIVATTVPANLT